MVDLTKKEEGRQKRALEMARVLRERYPGEEYVHTVLNWSNPWELTVAVILSARTTDKKVNEVTGELFKKYRTLDDYADADLTELQEDINSIGFYKNKAKYIIASAKMVRDEFGGRVPHTMEDILQLKGVARKTANVVLWNAYGKITGVPVDTHVRRFAVRFDLSDHTKPAKIEKDLMKILPKEEWPRFSHRLILYGREVCPGRKHECEDHPLTRLYPPAANNWPKSA